MRIALFLLLPTLAFSFVPQQQARIPSTILTEKNLKDYVDEVNDVVVDGYETVLETADSWVLKRVMSAVAHAPAILTLRHFATAAGSSRFGIDAAASTFSYSTPALLALPTWTGNVWRVACVCQIAALAKSILKVDKDDLSQTDISALTATNFAAAKALTSGSLSWLIATSVLSSYSARNGASSEPDITFASNQLVSSFTTIAATLGVMAALPNLIPGLPFEDELLSVIGVAGLYGIATREGNSTVKKIVTTLAVGGILYGKIQGLINGESVLKAGTLVTAGCAVVLFEGVNKVKDALLPASD